MLNHISLAARMVGALCLALSLSGCIGLIPSPFRPFPGPLKHPVVPDLAEAFDVVCRNYRLGPDDQLMVNFQTEWTIPAGTYHLDTLDVIDIEFILTPELDRQVTIRPDGMITLPGIGDVRAVGLTPEQLAGQIEDRLKKTEILRNGDIDAKFKSYKMVTVSVSQFYQKVKRLVESFTTLTGGQQVQITVKPDGTIDLPLLKDRILAVGNTVQDVERTINKLYRSGELKHVVASLALQNAKSRKVYILGEVVTAGAYDLRQPITPLQALALAGGHRTDSADLTSVILISKNVYGKPIARRLDLKRAMDVGDMSSQILLKPYDVIYVPRHYVGDLRLFMDQYVRTIAEVGQLASTLNDK